MCLRVVNISKKKGTITKFPFDMKKTIRENNERN